MFRVKDLRLPNWRGGAVRPISGESNANGWRSRRPHEKEAQVAGAPLCQWYDPVTLIAIVTLTMGLALAVGGGALEITGHYEQGELSFVVWVTE